MNEADSPLCGADCDNINAVLSSCAKVRQQIEKCKACKLPFDELESANNTHEALATAIKQQWFPGVA